MDFNTDQDDYGSNGGRLPRVLNTESRLKNVKSLNKLP